MSTVLESENSSVTAGVLDRAGICVSVLCLAQCLALAAVVVIGPLASLGIFGTDAFHRLLLAVILPVSLLAFGLGLRRHGNLRMLVPGLSGLAVLVVTAGLEAAGMNGMKAAAMTSLGGMLLITGHLLNIRARRLGNL